MRRSPIYAVLPRGLLVRTHPFRERVRPRVSKPPRVSNPHVCQTPTHVQPAQATAPYLLEGRRNVRVFSSASLSWTLANGINGQPVQTQAPHWKGTQVRRECWVSQGHSGGPCGGCAGLYGGSCCC